MILIQRPGGLFSPCCHQVCVCSRHKIWKHCVAAISVDVFQLCFCLCIYRRNMEKAVYYLLLQRKSEQPSVSDDSDIEDINLGKICRHLHPAYVFWSQEYHIVIRIHGCLAKDCALNWLTKCACACSGSCLTCSAKHQCSLTVLLSCSYFLPGFYCGSLPLIVVCIEPELHDQWWYSDWSTWLTKFVSFFLLRMRRCAHTG